MPGWIRLRAQRSRLWLVPVLTAFGLGLPVPAAPQGFAGGLQDAFGPLFEAAPTTQARAPAAPPPRTALVSWVRRWNWIAIDASGLDHTPPAACDPRVFGEQLGPGRSARAMAIVHIAIHDALNAILGEYESYSEGVSAPRGASPKTAIAQAAHDTLVALYPSQAASFDAALAADLAALRGSRAARDGSEVGRRAAAAILALRSGDGSDHPEPEMGGEYVPDDAPGAWRQDPISQVPIALGAHWGEVAPFVLASPDALRVPPPPALASPEYAAALAEAKALGGDGVATPTTRSEEQTLIGTFWAYDGTPSLCAPPRLYNQIAVQIADQMGSDALELARLLALVNTALADAGIAVWESKYHYALWRPVTAIREADGDGNDSTLADPGFVPLGAPASNLAGPNFTPPFPAYPSGHAGFGGALFETLRRFYGADAIPFAFVSDEFDGTTRDNEGHPRPRISRSFATLSEAEEENGQSRIYLGIHFGFDKTEGIAQGRAVAEQVFERAFRGVQRTHGE
jgi:hypothetical protein